jgi:hypothetical protein
MTNNEIRKFFATGKLNESYTKAPVSGNSFVEAFDELSRLYEADENNEKEAAAKIDADEKAATSTNSEDTGLSKTLIADDSSVNTNAATSKEEAAKEVKQAKEILSELKDADYAKFVDILYKDGKSKAFLDYLKQHYQLGDDSIQTVKKANASEEVVKCSTLHPTQQDISLPKSLGMISKPDWAIKIINEPENAFDDPTVVYAGQYIIDGHHRWSKAYALNGGDCSIKILNFPAIEGVSWEDMLKAAQLAIVAANPDAPKENNVDTPNMLTCPKKEVVQFFIENACQEVVDAMKAKGYGDTKEAIADRVGDNAIEMQKKSAPVEGAMDRKIMPQLDNDGQKGKEATPKLSKAVIDLTV